MTIHKLSTARQQAAYKLKLDVVRDNLSDSNLQIASVTLITFTSRFDLIIGGVKTQQRGHWLKVDVRARSLTRNVLNSCTTHSRGQEVHECAFIK